MIRQSSVALACVLAIVSGRGGFATENAALHAARESIRSSDLRRHVEVLADDTMEGRAAGTRGGYAAGGYIVEQLRKAKLGPAGADGGYFQSVPTGGRNVLAMLPGADPKLAREVIVVGGHYDHVGYGNRGNSAGPAGYIHNGADDNASGTSALLELAEALMLLPSPPKRSILIAFWDGEEDGMLGSKHWMAHPTVPRDRIVFFVNLDMVGRLRHDTMRLEGSRTAAGLRQLVSRQNIGIGLGLDFRWENKGNSDHWTFFSAGIPFVMFHTGEHEDYHRPSDDSHRLNYDGMERIGRLLLNIVNDMAERPTMPSFRRASQNELDEYSRRRWEAALPPPPGRLGIRWSERRGDQRGLPVQSVQPGSPAQRGGILPGDRIVSFGGRDTQTDDDLLAAVYAATGPVIVEILRSGKTETERLTVELAGKTPRIGVAWRDDEAEPGTPMIIQVLPGSPADMAGVRLHDRLHKVAGQPIRGTNELYELFRTLPEPLDLEIERWGRIQMVTLKGIRPSDDADETNRGGTP
jgi:membrane-associated protease RseP (regulator of RpoE activity)